MKNLSTQEMECVEGGASFYDRIVNPPKSNPVADPFMDHMKKTFGATAGRDLAKAAKKYGLVSLVNAIFGW